MQQITFSNSNKMYTFSDGNTYNGMSTIQNNNDIIITPNQEWVIQLVPTDYFSVASKTTFENNYDSVFGGSQDASLSAWGTRVIDGTLTVNKDIIIDYNGDGGDAAPVQTCFLENTLVNTDQGRIQISKINPTIHSIRNMEIKSVIKSTLMDSHMVFIEKDALYKNVPCENTFITQYHKLYYNKQLIHAYELVE